MESKNKITSITVLQSAFENNNFLDLNFKARFACMPSVISPARVLRYLIQDDYENKAVQSNRFPTTRPLILNFGLEF